MFANFVHFFPSNYFEMIKSAVCKFFNVLSGLLLLLASKNWIEFQGCPAFPDGIPDEILETNEHSEIKQKTFRPQVDIYGTLPAKYFLSLWIPFDDVTKWD